VLGGQSVGSRLSGCPASGVSPQSAFRPLCQAFALFVKRFHIVGEGFVGAAMPLVLCRMRKKVAVELTDMVQ